MNTSNALRTYEGDATVTFDGKEALSGVFVLTIGRNGHCSMTMQIELFNQLQSFKKVFDGFMRYRSKDEEFIKGKLNGKTTNGAEISSNWVAIARMVITGGPGQVHLNSSESTYSGQLVTCKIEFLVLSEIHIIYAKLLKSDDFVSSFSGIVNFAFNGCPDRQLGKYYIPDELVIRMGKERYEFVKLPEYKEVEGNLSSNKVDVTCESIIVAQANELQNKQEKLNDIMMLLSFVSCNWITSVYEDIFKNNHLVKTILKPHKTYNYLAGQSIIRLNDSKSCAIKRFVETGLEKYLELKMPFVPNLIIDYYLQATRQETIETRYLLFAVAMETIAACANDCARKEGLVIRNNGLESGQKKLKEIAEQTDVAINDAFLELFASRFGLNDIKVKDRLRFVFQQFDITYTENELREFGNYRNTLVHSGLSHDTSELSKQAISLANFLDRILLTMLGWKGQVYFDKANDYKETVLN